MNRKETEGGHKVSATLYWESTGMVLLFGGDEGVDPRWME